MRSSPIPRLVAAAAVALSLSCGTPAAQESNTGSIVVTLPAEMDSNDRQALIEALAALERPVAIADTDQATDALTAESQVAVAMGRWDAALASWRDLPELIATWWRGLSAEQTGTGSLLVIAAMLVALAVGAACEWGVDRLLSRWRRLCAQAQPLRFSRRAGYGLAWVGVEVLGIAAFAGGALLIGWLLLPALATPRLTLAIVVAAVVKARVVLTIGRFILAPYRPALRLVSMPDDAVRLVWRWVASVVTIIAAANGFRDVLVSSGASWESAALLGIGVALLAAVVRIVAIVQVRRPFHDLILQAWKPKSGEPSGVVDLSANIWHIVFCVLVVVDFAGVIYAGLLTVESRVASLAVGSFMVISLVPFALGGYGALIDDVLLSRGEDGRSLGSAGALKAFGQGVILLATFAFLARAWGADPFAGAEAGLLSRAAAALLQIGGAALLGWTIWQGSKLALDHYAVEEAEEANEDPMGKPGSRIATVLPVIRAFLFVAIITMSVLMALAALGVNIGPLLAGAGVIGLAVGFGAQTLVKDIITGLFYLVEDAFRKGEYIQSAAGKGVVEKISLRSVQLRHHNGPLHTIPFGSMGNITNHSRDWVRIKIKIHVPFNTDLNKMRKAIKKVGEAMQEDPELGPMFLEPLKSQGAVDTDAAGFITSVKFVSRPGEQFILRREAFARIQKAFQENGIEFAEPRVTVASKDGDDHHEGAAAGVALARNQ
ncbi:mechanosensitive ion channel domain-containing protein [Pelagibius sp. 7325]|uniref:mechanosensitive ion channel family protein n=2 Tax=Pseudomonadati TaxID=3379134 RepID=UPI0030EB86D6